MRTGPTLKKIVDKLTFFYPEIRLYERFRLRAHNLYDALHVTPKEKVPLKNLVSKFRGEVSHVRGVDEAVNFVFSWTAYGVDIRPYQVSSEIAKFARLAGRPETVLEVGTAKGGTLFLLTKIADPSAIIISVDLPHRGPGESYDRTLQALFSNFTTSNQNLHLLKMNSHKTSTVRKVQEILNGRKLDVAFIDGDHTCRGVRRDFEIYRPLMAKNGIMAFHDISVYGDDYHMIDVYKFWNEVKDHYKHAEILDERKPLGIGVLYV